MLTSHIATRSFRCGFVVFCLAWTSATRAATPVVSDLTDFIQVFGGYLFTVTDKNTPAELFWEQASYKVTPATTSSNITTVMMTKFSKAAVYIVSGSGSSSQLSWSSTTANPTSLNFCAASDYVVETITLDLRNLKATAIKQPSTTTNGNKIFSISLQMNDGTLIRQNTQTLPANCSPQTGYRPVTNIKQKDVSSYDVEFALEDEAIRFLSLLSNVIPTLNPPILIGT